MALDRNLPLREGQLLARRHHDLRAHDVDAGDPLGHRVLDLHTRVHLDEIELAVLVQKLEGAGAAVADFLAGGHAALANALDQAARNARCRPFFDHLLVAPLHGAIALAQVDRVAVLVGKDLDLDVARVLEKLLHVHRRVVEGRRRLGLGGLHRVQQRRLGVHHAHAAPATAARRLDDDRVANRLGDALDRRRVVGQFTFGARHAGHPGLDHGLLGRHLVAHDADRLGRRADELEAALLHTLGKVGVFAEKAVAGVDGFGIGHFSRRDDGRHVQIALPGRRWANTHSLFGQLHILGFAVRL